jgi:hypothetical protein
MPNTLAHIGVGALATRGVIRNADLRWALVGVLLPDVPWILGRMTKALTPGLHDHQLWAYLIAQSSLAVSLLLCAVLASLAARPASVFGILSLNALVHLALDGLQGKWRNGVHLFGPLSWQDWNAGWFGVESWVSYALTALGLSVGPWVLVQSARSPLGLAPSNRRVLVAASLLALYLTVSIPLRHGPLLADTNSVGTLNDRSNRAGRAVQFDRVAYLAEDSTHDLRTYVGETLPLKERWLDENATVPARGTFADDSTIALTALHRHPGQLRDWWSGIGRASSRARSSFRSCHGGHPLPQTRHPTVAVPLDLAGRSHQAPHRFAATAPRKVGSPRGEPQPNRSRRLPMR